MMTIFLINEFDCSKMIDADSGLVQLSIKTANLYIEDIEIYFLITEKTRHNKRLVQKMKTSDVV